MVWKLTIKSQIKNKLIDMRNNGLIRRDDSPFNELVRKFFGDDNFIAKPFGFMNEYFDFSVGRTNVLNNEKEYVVQVSVPGFKKDDIKLDLEDDVLTISSAFEDSKEETGENYSRKEFVKSSFSRSFTLPDNVDASKIDAKMEDGILNVIVPKLAEEKKTSKFSIKVK